MLLGVHRALVTAIILLIPVTDYDVVVFVTAMTHKKDNDDHY